VRNVAVWAVKYPSLRSVAFIVAVLDTATLLASYGAPPRFDIVDDEIVQFTLALCDTALADELNVFLYAFWIVTAYSADPPV
jgi:hypothetical protein